MIISFTGTQDGMTGRQMDKVKELLEELNPTIVIHGDCIGADEEFHRIIELKRGFGKHPTIKIYPSDREKKRANCNGDIIMPQMPPLERNELIVSEGDRLIACPKEMAMVLRSGTWTTIRKAKIQGKIIYVILPNGKIV